MNFRNSLKASLSYNLENPLAQVQAIGLNVEHANAHTNPEELFKNIDAVSVNDVNAVNTKLYDYKLNFRNKNI